jgi:hypothetical protein
MTEHNSEARQKPGPRVTGIIEVDLTPYVDDYGCLDDNARTAAWNTLVGQPPCPVRIRIGTASCLLPGVLETLIEQTRGLPAVEVVGADHETVAEVVKALRPPGPARLAVAS